MLGVRTDGEHHVVAGGEDLLAGVIGGRHLGETKFDIGVDQQDLRDGVGAERDDRGLALGEVLRALLVGDAGVRSGVGEELGFLLDCGLPQFLERGLALLELGVLRFGNQRAGQGGERCLGGPGVGHGTLQRVDAGVLEGVEHIGELAPGGRRILRVKANLAEQSLVVDVAGGVTREGQAIQALLGGIGGLHQILGDLHHAGVEGVHNGFIGEVVEHTGGGEVAEGLGVGGVVDVDLDGRVLLLKVGDHGLELVGGLGLELEEIQRDGACGAGAAACQAEPDGDRAHHGGGAHGQTLQSRRCMWGIGQHNC